MCVVFVGVVFVGVVREVFVEQFPALSGRTVCLHDPVFIVCVLSLQELFVKYSWNSFLHSQVVQCVYMIQYSLYVCCLCRSCS